MSTVTGAKLAAAIATMGMLGGQPYEGRRDSPSEKPKTFTSKEWVKRKAKRKLASKQRRTNQ